MTTVDTIHALLDWAAEGGVRFEPLEIRVDEAGNRSTFARRTLAAGEALVVVPRAMIISEADMARSEVGAAVQRFGGMLYNRHVVAAVWLARERRDPASPWKPYLDALPQTFPGMPLLRTAEELAGLTGTRALLAIVSDARNFADDHQLLGEMVPELATLDRDELAWGRCVAGSRSFHLEHDGDQMRCLVPIADMLDHDAEASANASWRCRPDASDFAVRSRRALVAGEEVRHCYGDHDNARMLASYGFAIAGNRLDEVALCFGATERRTFGVGLVFDRRFRTVLRVAAATIESDDVRAVLAAVAVAADTALALIDDAPAPTAGDAAWLATCTIIRDGERAVLLRIASAARVAVTVEAFADAIEGR